jgi:hypothetical protein
MTAALSHEEILALVAARHGGGKMVHTVEFRRSYAVVREYASLHPDFSMNNVSIGDGARRIRAWYHRDRLVGHRRLRFLRCALVVWVLEQGFEVEDPDAT